MLVRVFQPPNAAVIVATPTLKEGESEADAFARYVQRLGETQPELAGLPFVDVDDSTLPSREARHAWRVANGKVVVDPNVEDPAQIAEQERAESWDAITSDPVFSQFSLAARQGFARLVGMPEPQR